LVIFVIASEIKIKVMKIKVKIKRGIKQ